MRLALLAPIVGLAALLSVVAAPPHPRGACRNPARLAAIPAGPFWMGSDARERALARSLSSPATVAADWFNADLPQQRIQTDAFCIDRLLVTQTGTRSSPRLPRPGRRGSRATSIGGRASSFTNTTPR